MATLVCPICGNKVTAASKDELPYRPFCSERCKRVDLGRWLSGEYVISESLSGNPPLEKGPDEPDADPDAN